MNDLTELLDAKHRKKEFLCGKDMLDRYFHEQANQDIKKKLSACFVKDDDETGLGLGTGIGLGGRSLRVTFPFRNA